MNNGYDIFTGRFQPFHLGHYLVLRHITQASDSEIIIGIVNPDPLHPMAGDQTKDWHRFEAALNPLNYWERYYSITLALKGFDMSNRVRGIVPLARPSVNMKRVDQFLPPQPRRFVLCQKWNDEVESWKAKRYEENGEDTYVIQQSELSEIASAVDANLIRALICTGSKSWKRLIPANCIEYLISIGIEDRIKAVPDANANSYIAEYIAAHPNKELIINILETEELRSHSGSVKDIEEWKNSLIQVLISPHKDNQETRIVIVDKTSADLLENISTALFKEAIISERISRRPIDQENVQIELSSKTHDAMIRKLGEKNVK